MSSIGKAIGKVVGGITGASDSADAAVSAAGIQAASSQQAVVEQRRQFDEIVKLMEPFVTLGTEAFEAQGDLLGLGEEGSQQAAIDALMAGPEYQTLLKEGEQAILQNASATGGLRGGNTQSALMEFRPNLLSNVINQRYSRLGGLSQLGQASAGMQASAGQAAASNVGNLLQQQGAALAGGELAAGNLTRNAFGDMLKIGTGIAGLF